MLKDTKILVLKPAPDTDLTAYEVKRNDGSSSAVINLSELLRQNKVAVASGGRSGSTSPLLPRAAPWAPASL